MSEFTWTILFRIASRAFVVYMAATHFHDWKYGLAAFCIMSGSGYLQVKA